MKIETTPEERTWLDGKYDIYRATLDAGNKLMSRDEFIRTIKATTDGGIDFDRLRQEHQQKFPSQDTLAQAVLKISEAMRKLMASGLNTQGIIILLQDSTGLPKRDIKAVLDGLEGLKRRYTR